LLAGPWPSPGRPDEGRENISPTPSNDPSADVLAQAKPPFLRRVRVGGYKSIAFCDVTLEPLTILVGRNASGKSNFLDALAFLRDCVKGGVPEAVQRRGNMQTLLCRSMESNALTFEIETSFTAGANHTEHQAHYRLNIPAVLTAGFLAHGEPEEWLSIEERVTGWRGSVTGLGVPRTVQVFSGKVEPGIQIPPTNTIPLSIASGQLMLNYLGQPPYSEWAECLRRMAFYDFIPDAMRPLKELTSGQLLDRTGGNLASVLDSTRQNDNWAFKRVGGYLSAVVPEVERFGTVRYGGYETIHFWLGFDGPDKTLDFDAGSMSDGTLRVLAALTAAFQSVLPYGCPSVVGIEEPESTLHPAAMRALVDALDEATLRTQILLTTHSAEMLDNPTIRPENVRVVQMIDGQTVIAPVDEASVEIVRQKLDTLGGLGRQNQLEPDGDDHAHFLRPGEANAGELDRCRGVHPGRCQRPSRRAPRTRPVRGP
jgi:predicted ATPase